jgi:uncharacterized protein (DUF3084 family)
MRSTLARVAVAGLAAGICGCADYSGIEKDLHDMRTQLSQVSTDVSAMRSSLDSATEETRQAAQKAAAATSTANQALTMAQSDQSAIEHLNEKLDSLDHASSKHKKAKKKPAADAPKTP